MPTGSTDLHKVFALMGLKFIFNIFTRESFSNPSQFESPVLTISTGIKSGALKKPKNLVKPLLFSEEILSIGIQPDRNV